MKLAFDLLNIALFFLFYKLYGIYTAVGAAMALYTFQTAVLYQKNRTIDKVQLITLALILLLGGATFLFHNELFFKWKPTAVYLLFACIFLGMQCFSKKTAIAHLLDQAITAPEKIWRRLNIVWAIFFIIMAGLNLFVAYNFDTDTWVNFKLFGILGLTFIFILAQSFYLSRHSIENEENNEQ